MLDPRKRIDALWKDWKDVVDRAFSLVLALGGALGIIHPEKVPLVWEPFVVAIGWMSLAYAVFLLVDLVVMIRKKVKNQRRRRRPPKKPKELHKEHLADQFNEIHYEATPEQNQQLASDLVDIMDNNLRWRRALQIATVFGLLGSFTGTFGFIANMLEELRGATWTLAWTSVMLMMFFQPLGILRNRSLMFWVLKPLNDAVRAQRTSILPQDVSPSEPPFSHDEN